MALGFPCLILASLALPSMVNTSWGEAKVLKKSNSQPSKTWSTTPVQVATDFTTQKLIGQVISRERAIISTRRA